MAPLPVKDGLEFVERDRGIGTNGAIRMMSAYRAHLISVGLPVRLHLPLGRGAVLCEFGFPIGLSQRWQNARNDVPLGNGET